MSKAEIEEVAEESVIETPALDEPENEVDEEESEVEESAEERVVVSIGDEEPPEEPRAPDWVRELRKSHRELQRKVKEYEAKEHSAPAYAAVPTLGAKPKLEDHDYDTEKYETALESWYVKKDAVEAAKRQQQHQMDEQQKSWQSKLDSYSKAKNELKVKDFEDAESTVQDTLNTVQQGVVLQGAENPALVIYALGKNPKKAKELASISDPVKFAFAVAKLESQLKVTSSRKPPPPERSTPTGNAPISGSTDSTLERLRADAERTGDMTKVIRYRQQQREKQSAKR
jgi:hypothetical protein